MGIVDNVKNFIEYNKNITNGRRLEKLNKSIELMSLREITNELNSRLIKINKEDKFDSRDEKLINYVLNISDKGTEERLFYILSNLKSQSLKLQFLEKFGNQFSLPTLDSIFEYADKYKELFAADKKAIREANINSIKYRINSFTSRFGRKKTNEQINLFSLPEVNDGPFTLKIKHDEADRASREHVEIKQKIISELFVKNYERINIHDFLKRTMTWSPIEDIYVKLPKDIQGQFIIEYLNSSNSLILNEDREKIAQILIDLLPRETLSFEILQRDNYSGARGDIFSRIKEKIDLNFSDIQSFYRQTGYLPYTDIQSKLESADEIIEDLKYFKSDDEKEKFIRYTYFDISSEELNRLLENENVESELKILIYKNLLYRKDTSEQIEICNKIISLSKDDKEKNDYKMFIASLNGQYDEIFKILKSGEFRNLDFINYNDKVLLNFSDEQIKELYNTTENTKLKCQLLNLSRIDEKNNSYSILVNKDNYISFFKNAKSYNEIYELLIRREFEKIKEQLDFDQILELYNDFKSKELKYDKKDTWIKNHTISQFEIWLLKDINIEKMIKLADSNIEKEKLQSIVSYMNQDSVTVEKAEKYILDALKIQDIEMKSLILFEINKKVSYDIDRKSKTERLEKIYQQLLDSDDINISNKYILLSTYVSLISTENYLDKKQEEEKFKKIELKFKKLNETTGRTKYSEIFDLTPQYQFSELLKRDINVKNYENIANCLKYLDSDFVYEKLTTLYNQNHSIIEFINPTMLKEEVIKTLDDETIEFISRYSVDTSSFGKIFEDETKTIIFLKANDRLKSTKAYSEEDAIRLADFINKLDSKNLKGSQDYIDLILSISLNKEFENKFLDKKRYNREEENIFGKFIENLKHETREEIHSPLLNRMEGIDAIGKRFFGLPYETMENLVNQYSSDLDIMLRKYESKSKSYELTLEEKNELHSLRILRNIKEILAIQDKKAIIETYDELDKLDEFQNIDFSLSYTLDENLRRVYTRDYKENIYTINSEDQMEEIDGIKVYSPKQFNMIVHVVAAFGDFKLIDKKHPEISAEEMWKNVDNKQNHILCTSMISEDNLCFTKSKDNEEQKVIFGFSSIGENSVLMAAPYDLGSATTIINSDVSYYKSSFRCAKNMIEETRANHNEISIERRIENQKDKNIEPDYIVCIDEITEESKKVANDFRIPIVLLNTNLMAKNSSEKLNGLLKQFYEKKDPSNIPEILNLYQTNYYSYFSFKPELVEQYFNPTKMNEEMKKMLQVIDREYKIGDKEKAIQCYNIFSNSLEKEMNLLLSNMIDSEEATKGKFKIRELNYVLKQRCKKVKKENHNSTKCKDKIKEDSSQNLEETRQDRRGGRKQIKQDKEGNSSNGREED